MRLQVSRILSHAKQLVNEINPEAAARYFCQDIRIGLNELGPFNGFEENEKRNARQDSNEIAIVRQGRDKHAGLLRHYKSV